MSSPTKAERKLITKGYAGLMSSPDHTHETAVESLCLVLSGIARAQVEACIAEAEAEARGSIAELVGTAVCLATWNPKADLKSGDRPTMGELQKSLDVFIGYANGPLGRLKAMGAAVAKIRSLGAEAVEEAEAEGLQYRKASKVQPGSGDVVWSEADGEPITAELVDTVCAAFDGLMGTFGPALEAVADLAATQRSFYGEGKPLPTIDTEAEVNAGVPVEAVEAEAYAGEIVE